MTIRPYKLTRELAREWPLFTEGGVSPELGVLSIQVQRRSRESIDSAISDAAKLLGASLSPLLEARHGRLWVVALGRPVPRSSRLAAYRAERDGLWKALQTSGVRLPDGSRVEAEIANSPDVLRFGGYIELTGELQVGLDLTRCANAVVFGGLDGHTEPTWISDLSSLDLLSIDSVGLLRASIQQLDRGHFAVRAFGCFDDFDVGIDVFAKAEILESLEPALRASPDCSRG